MAKLGKKKATTNNGSQPSKHTWIRPVILNIIAGILVLLFNNPIFGAVDWIIKKLSIKGETFYPDLLFLGVAFFAWLATTSLVNFISKNPKPARTIDALLVLLVLLLLFIPMARKQDAILEHIRVVEKKRVTSTLSQLHRAIHRAFLVYDKNPKLRDLFTDRTHEYSDISINFFEVGTAAISHYVVSGKTKTPSIDGNINLPLATNVELPHKPEDLVFIEDLISKKPIDFRWDEIGTEYKTFLYRISFDDFEGEFKYSRLFHHPTSQTFNPDAFLLFLDFIETEFDTLTVNIFSDKPLAMALLVHPERYNTDESLFSWTSIPAKHGRISKENLSQIPRSVDATDSTRPATKRQIVDGYTFRVDDARNMNKRMILIYFKDELDVARFL